MGLATDIMKHFGPASPNAGTALSTFMESHAQWNNATDVQLAINRLVLETYLLFTAFTWDMAPLNRCYQTLMYDSLDVDYGTYDFIVYGFVSVYERFRESVLQLEYEGSTGSLQSGTAFIAKHADKLIVVTAAHCVENAKSIRMLSSNHSLSVPVSVYLPKASNHSDGFSSSTDQLDIAVIEYSASDLEGYDPFRLAIPKVLDDVLVMGYPPASLVTSRTSGEIVLLAERSSVSAIPNSGLRGQVTGGGHGFLTGQNYIVVSARVKGGNSGGPVINKRGEVIGLISNFPTSGSSTSSLELDPNGFGLAVPGQDISEFLRMCFSGESADETFFNRHTPVRVDGSLCKWKI